MSARHPAFLFVAILAAVGIAACAGGNGGEEMAREEMAGQEMAESLPSLGSHSSCDTMKTRRGVTSQVQVFRVKNESLEARPDPVVQNPGIGFFGWQATGGYAWRVTFTDDTVPTARRSYSGEANGPVVIARVRPDAPCQYYKWDVELWKPGDSAATYMRVDPGGVVEPYP